MSGRGFLALTNLGMRNQTELLARKVDPGRRAEPELVGVPRDRRASYPEPGLVEENVAGLDDRTTEVDAAVATFLPVLEGPRAEMELAVAVRAVHRCQRAFLQARRGDDDLEDRPRRVLTLDHAVQQRMPRVLHHLEPRRAIDRAGEPVDLEGRRRHHREHVPGSRVHYHHGAGVALERPLRRFLDAPVERRVHLRAGL